MSCRAAARPSFRLGRRRSPGRLAGSPAFCAGDRGWRAGIALGSPRLRLRCATWRAPCWIRGSATRDYSSSIIFARTASIPSGDARVRHRLLRALRRRRAAEVERLSQAPILARPKNLGALAPYPDRRAILSGAIDSETMPVVWLRDAVEVFLIQVQGSARVKLDDGTKLRLIYDGRNGRPYTSIGRKADRKRRHFGAAGHVAGATESLVARQWCGQRRTGGCGDGGQRILRVFPRRTVVD